MSDPRFEKPASELRRRMLAGMAVRQFTDKTQHDYMRHPANLTVSQTAELGYSGDSHCERWRADWIGGSRIAWRRVLLSISST